ncbi:MAG TPA: hypothetical protein VIW27_05050 [Gammaproteobacteria bacterium]|jgi:hypothetical protein
MIFETEAERVREFVRDGNYHAAYNIALSAMNACRRDGDQSGVDACIALIREIVDSLADEFGGEQAD